MSHDPGSDGLTAIGRNITHTLRPFKAGTRKKLVRNALQSGELKQIFGHPELRRWLAGLTSDSVRSPAAPWRCAGGDVESLRRFQDALQQVLSARECAAIRRILRRYPREDWGDLIGNVLAEPNAVLRLAKADKRVADCLASLQKGNPEDLGELAQCMTLDELTIMRRKLDRDRQTDKRRRGPRHVPLTPSSLGAAQQLILDHVGAIEDTEQILMLRAAIRERLTPDTARMLLRHYDGLTLEQVGRECGGLTKSAVCDRLANAIVTLRAFMTAGVQQRMTRRPGSSPTAPSRRSPARPAGPGRSKTSGRRADK